MPVTTIYPAGTTSASDFPPAGGGGDCHTPLSDLSDGTYCAKQAYTAESHYCYGDLVTQMPGGVGRITSVTVFARANCTAFPGGGNLQGGVKVGGGFYGYLNLVLSDTIANQTGSPITLNPFTGQPWSVADINGMGWWVGGYNYRQDGNIIWVYELSFDVTWETAAGGFAYLLV